MIAAVNGWALGGGFELALMRFYSCWQKCKIWVTRDVGAFSGDGGTQRVPRIIESQVMYMQRGETINLKQLKIGVS